MMTPEARFSDWQAQDAHAAWGANCGPGAIAGVLGLTLDAVRPHMGDFEEKGYTNPTLMWSALRSLGVSFDVSRKPEFPEYGLARIQWEGPWTATGVPARVAYRHTHWVGAARNLAGGTMIFDINAMSVGGWVGLGTWSDRLVPWLLGICEPKANGKWHVTHSVAVPISAIREATS